MSSSQVKVVVQVSSGLATARRSAQGTSGRWPAGFLRHKLVILTRPFYNPRIATNLIFPDERSKCK
ncbi:hypothetical protein ABD07_13165 [Nitrosomonas oligotropha]|nr:hypothetical protein [Nitrosomonas oligotropha]